MYSKESHLSTIYLSSMYFTAFSTLFNFIIQISMVELFLIYTAVCQRYSTGLIDNILTNCAIVKALQR